MRVLVTGSSGLIGGSLVPALASDGHEVLRLVRRPPRDRTELAWDPAAGSIDPRTLEGLEAVFHLAGESLASGRWTRDRKARIRASRVEATRLLANSLARLERPPRVLVSVSAIGYYGNRGDEPLTEESPPGTGFLAELTRDWEAAAAPAADRGVRVVHARLGLVLSSRGGALARLLVPFRLGLGGPIAEGRAWWSWIAIDDVVEVMRFALAPESMRGALNAVAPEPVRQVEFTRALGAVLRRPTPFSVPAPVLRALLGEMADEMLLASARVLPARLLAAGFRFRFPELGEALRHVLRTAQRARAAGVP